MCVCVCDVGRCLHFPSPDLSLSEQLVQRTETRRKKTFINDYPKVTCDIYFLANLLLACNKRRSKVCWLECGLAISERNLAIWWKLHQLFSFKVWAKKVSMFEEKNLKSSKKWTAPKILKRNFFDQKMCEIWEMAFDNSFVCLLFDEQRKVGRQSFFRSKNSFEQIWKSNVSRNRLLAKQTNIVWLFLFF